MPYDVNRNFFTQYDGYVSGIDIHPTEPFLLICTISGNVIVYSLESGTCIHTFKVATLSLRSLKLFNGKNWFVAGSDDGQIHVFDYITREKVVSFKAHSDWIRALAIHPTSPILLSGSYDGTIKSWDWDKQWDNIQTYQATPFLTSIAFNPNDPNIFASVCKDGYLKLWSLASPQPKFTIEAHKRSAFCVDFYPFPDKPLLITSSYDDTIKVWDYVSERCVQTITGHRGGLNFAVFHPNLPIIISGTSDKSVKIWDSGTYAILQTLDYQLDFASCVALRKNTNEIALGFTKFVVTLELNNPGLRFSINHSGNLIYAHNHKVISTNLQTLDTTTLTSSSDGAQIPLQTTDLGSINISAFSVLQSPNNSFVIIVGDGEYVIYASFGWCEKSRGAGISLAWAPDSKAYAVLETQTKLKVYKNLEEQSNYVMKGAGSLLVEALHGGPVLGARGPGYVIFWDWETGDIVMRIDIDVNSVYWNTTGTHIVITSFDTFYIYYFDRDAYQDRLKKSETPGHEGVPEAFVLLTTLHDTILTAGWFGECLIYTTHSRLCYLIASTKPPETPSEEQAHDRESCTISPIDNKLYALAYIPEHGRVYVADGDMRLYGFVLSFAVVEFQTAVLRGDMGGAREWLKKVPKGQAHEIAKFLEKRDINEFALDIAELEQRFEHALSLDDCDRVDRHEMESYKKCTALVMEFMRTKAADKFISEKLSDDKAQDLVEFLSKMVDDKVTFSQRERRHTLHILSKLAKSAGVFPRYLVLEGVQCSLAYPVAWGGFGVIFKGEHEGNPICVKAVQIDSRGVDRNKTRAHAGELTIWANVKHRNILPFLGIYPSGEEVSRICIVSPWMNNGDLLQYLRLVPDAPRKLLVCDIIAGLQYLHDFNIIHADLKAKNVLVSETGRAMLADFGISRLSMTHSMTSANVSAGTAYWMAPELLVDDELPSRPSDIWALACTCYEIIAGMMPFSEYRNAPLLIGAFMRGKIVPSKPTPGIGWDEDVWSMATQCWQSDPASRPTAQELLEMMNSFDLSDDRSSDVESKTTKNSTKIDYDRILSILEEVRKFSIV